MNKKQRMFFSAVALAATLLSGCASRTAPGFKGRWVSVNQFAERTEAIPIRPSYVFYASPVDATLKNLLGRWAKDANKALSYQHPEDFTLYEPVARIRTNNLDLALTALNKAYADQRVSIVVDKNTIVVDQFAPEPSLGDPRM